MTVVVSLAGFMVIARNVVGKSIGNMVVSMYTVQLDQSIRAFEHGGVEELTGFLVTLDQAFNAEHHLIDASGHDVVTGDDRSRIIASVRANGGRPVMVGGRVGYARESANQRYSLLVMSDPPFSAWSFAPFYVLLLASVLLISWLVAVGIASPLRTLAATADRFGRGDLAARVAYRGKNEIGTVAASFNEMAERLQTLLTAERRLLQDVSHELRSPLARLNFAAELARTAPDRHAAIDRLQREIDRLGSLVAELLEVTRAEGDPAARTMRPVDVDALVSQTVDACMLDADARQCRIVVEGRAPAGLAGDAELLRRAIENVLRNAIQHAPAGTEVHVTVRQDTAQTAIAVRDFGPGVPDSSLEKIFEAFFRVDESRQAEAGGVGLGLSITHRAIQLHHGRVRAENAAPGLRVIMTLPSVYKSSQSAD